LVRTKVGNPQEVRLGLLRNPCQKNLHHAYIEGFAGAGQHISKRSKELIPGSPQNALNIEPPFEEYYLVDLNSARAAELRRQTASKSNVHVYCGDSNETLVSEVFPKIQCKD
jgi:three-Cys-motif partner protein